eukprot:scaffold43511_cov57-Phaeocystis_antarctica.AAC.1
MAVWRPEIRSSFTVAGSGGQAGGSGGGGDGGGAVGGWGEPACHHQERGEPASCSRRAAAVSAASTGTGRVWGGAVNWATVALSSLTWASCAANLAMFESSSRAISAS